jgi:geranylgeranyl diphosphate synthase type II
MDSSRSPELGPRPAAFPERLVRLVDEHLATLRWNGEPDLEPFDRALHYPLEAGGKRLRPVLLLATVEALGEDPVGVLPAAAALEYVHTFSLVHDDLPSLDDDSLRRGVPTVHVAFGEDVAVLVGDALLNCAYRLLLERQTGPAERRLEALGVLARAVDGMIRGQFLDVRGNGPVDEASLRRLGRLKTGCLIGAAVSCGLVLAGAPPAARRPYEDLAAELGVGFQIVDDVLDATGSAATLGKPAGSDGPRGKGHVAALGLDRAVALRERSERRAEALLDALPGDPAALRAITERVYRRDR